MAEVVIRIATKQDWDEIVLKGGGKLIVVDFSASWCGPCKFISPKFKDMAKEMQDKFSGYEVDVDENDEVAGSCGIKCMPTFQFYKNGAKIAEFSGANEAKLRELIGQHA